MWICVSGFVVVAAPKQSPIMSGVAGDATKRLKAQSGTA